MLSLNLNKLDKWVFDRNAILNEQKGSWFPIQLFFLFLVSKDTKKWENKVETIKNIKFTKKPFNTKINNTIRISVMLKNVMLNILNSLLSGMRIEKSSYVALWSSRKMWSIMAKFGGFLTHLNVLTFHRYISQMLRRSYKKFHHHKLHCSNYTKTYK